MFKRRSHGLTAEHKLKLKEIFAYMEKHKIYKHVVAQQLGFSQSALSGWTHYYSPKLKSFQKLESWYDDYRSKLDKPNQEA